MRSGYDNRLSWQEVAYIVMSILIILLGTKDVLIGMGVFDKGVAAFGLGAYVGILGGIQAILGIALLFQQTWAQFLMKWMCILGGIWSLLGVCVGLMLITKVPLLFVFAVFDCGSKWFMVYLISVVGDVDI